MIGFKAGRTRRFRMPERKAGRAERRYDETENDNGNSGKTIP